MTGRTTLWRLAAVAAALAALAGAASAQEGGRCSTKFTPTFCANVNWQISADTWARVTKGSQELQVRAMHADFDGSRYCKAWYRELQCRYVFARCEGEKDIRPCRSECERFAADCPGALQPCDAFPTRASECEPVPGY